MTAFPRVPVVYAEGKPGNVVVCSNVESAVEAAVEGDRGSARMIVPGPILLLGAPGVGKGTQAKELVQDLGDTRRFQPATCSAPMWPRERRWARWPKRSCTGENWSRTPWSTRWWRFGCSSRIRPKATFWMGFRGRLAQADWLDGRLAMQTEALPVVAVSIQVDYNQLLRRITGRRNCPVCQTIYNVYFKAAPSGLAFAM